MQERGAVVVGGLVLLLLLFPLGAVLHVSPRFPGSLAGSLVGIAGAALMLVPLLYLVVKRVPRLRRSVTRRVSMRTLLAVHIYAGVLGPILGVVHTAHKFRSPLGVSLLGMTLVVVVSGYVGRYLLGQIGRAIQGRRSELAALAAAFERASAEAASDPGPPPAWRGLLARWSSRLLAPAGPRADAVAAAPGAAAERALRLADAMADTEYAIRAEEVVRDLFTKWLKLHIAIAMILYALLALHVWSGLYYGLRWLR
jgi:uncharacterized membrane protein YsdA (DUF1294 family)